MGALIAACLLQRGDRIQQTAAGLGKQCATLMVEHFHSFAIRQNAEMLAESRSLRHPRERIDFAIRHKLFDDVHTGLQPSLAKSREALNIAGHDSQVLKASYHLL